MSRRRGSEAPNWQGGKSKVYRKCEYCGRTFAARPYDLGKYCSGRCSNAVRSELGRESCTCQHCGRHFETHKSRPQTYCSRDCLHAHLSGRRHPNWKEKVVCTCEWCGAQFERQPGYLKHREHLFCSLECRYAWYGDHISGENAPHWNGGSSYEPYPVTFNAAFKKKIRQRDKHQCAICRLPGKCVHHINYVKDDTDPDNCLTLCRKCHGVTNLNRDYWQAALSKLLQARTIGAAYG